MIKKIVIKLLPVFFLLFFAFPAHGIMLEEVRDDLDDLRARTEQLVKKVESALENMEPATFPDIPDDFRFPEVSSYRYEDYGPEIKYMQMILNADPETRLAESGIGSPGNEMERFGNITKNALIKFQEKYANEILEPWGIYQPTGIAAIQTQKKMNKILDGEVIIKVIPPEKQEEIKNEILEIAEEIQSIRKRLDEIGDIEEGAEDAAQNIRGAIIGYGEVRLTWRGDRDAEYFTAYVGEKSGGPYEVYGDTTDLSGIVKGLTEGKTYYLTVTQTIDGRESGHSREVKVDMSKIDPTPFDIRTEATDIGELELTWETDQRNISEYRIYRSTKEGGPYAAIGESQTEKFTDTGLGFYTVYHYVITQVVRGEESDFSAEHIDSWYNSWYIGQYPHPEKEKILEELDYTL